MYVCIYIYICVWIYIYIYVYVYMYVYVYVYVYIYYTYSCHAIHSFYALCLLHKNGLANSRLSLKHLQTNQQYLFFFFFCFFFFFFFFFFRWNEFLGLAPSHSMKPTGCRRLASFFCPCGDFHLGSLSLTCCNVHVCGCFLVCFFCFSGGSILVITSTVDIDMKWCQLPFYPAPFAQNTFCMRSFSLTRHELKLAIINFSCSCSLLFLCHHTYKPGLCLFRCVQAQADCQAIMSSAWVFESPGLWPGC